MSRTTASVAKAVLYELNLAEGGKAFVIGNIIQQGSNTGSPIMFAYGQAAGAQNAIPGRDLHVIDNTFVNEKAGAGVFVSALIDTTFRSQVDPRNNIFAGDGTFLNDGTNPFQTNFGKGDPLFVDPQHFDYHLQPTSPCVNAGANLTDPALAPVAQYVHPLSSEGRVAVGTIDIGAFELGGGTDAGPPPDDAGAAGAGPGMIRDGQADGSPTQVDGSGAGGGVPATDAAGTGGGGSAPTGGTTSGSAGASTGGGNAGGGNGGASTGAGGSTGGGVAGGTTGASGATIVDASPPDGQVAAEDRGGCGCRVGSGSSRSLGSVMLLVAGALAKLRRSSVRRRRFL